MNKEEIRSLVAIFIVVLIGLGVAWAGSQNSANLGVFPVFGMLVALAFLIQWLVFIPAFLQQSEKFFDITGSLTYISVTVLAILLSPKVDARSIILLVMVIIWAGRLGTFLFKRVHKSGKDDRFDDIKPSFPRFLLTWTLQGLWVTFTLAAALVAITTTVRRGIDIFAIVGSLVWAFGFAIEAISDAQKNKFRADPGNKGKFIRTGLWSRSRHPNYFGEITLWLGVAIIALPVLQGWQWISMISPIFVTLLLTRISGVPMLEKKGDTKWGGQQDYEEYKRTTPVLIPRLKK